MDSTMQKLKIAVAGTGYVGLSNAVLLAQHNEVKAVDLVAEKVEMLKKLLREQVRNGRCTPGKTVKNDRQIELRLN